MATISKGLTRRALLCGASLLAVSASCGAQTTLLGSSNTIAAAFNGGKSQIQTWLPGIGGDFPFLNQFLMGQGWGQSGGGGVDPSQLDANGWPTSVTGGGLIAVFYIPAQSSRPGNYYVTWDGNGTVTCTTATLVSGSLTSSGGSGSAILAPTSNKMVVGISVVGSPHITNLKFFHVNDLSLVVAGEIWSPIFTSTLAALKCGVMRFLDWQLGNTSNLTTWATRKPVSYAYYAAPEPRGSLYAGATGGTGDDYTATLGLGGPTDKQTVLVKFDRSASTINCTFNLNGTGALPILRTFANVLTTNGRPVAGSYAALTYDAAFGSWLKYGGDANDLNQYLNNGLPPELMVQLCARLGMHPYFVLPYYAADPITDWPSSLAGYIKSNGPSWMIPRFEGCNESWNSIFNQTHYGWNKQLIRNGGTTVYPVTGMTYTGTGATGSSTITIGAHTVPVGANVFMSNTFVGVSGWNNQNANVTAIGATTVTVNRAPTGGTYASGGSFTGGSQDIHNWYGTVISNLGQAISAVYGNDRTKYQVLCGVQTDSVPAQSNERLASTTYVLEGGSAAFNWVTTVCNAQYIAPTDYGTNQEMIDAYAYSLGDTSKVATYGNTLAGSITTRSAAYVGWKAWAAGFSVNKMCGYEGSYGPPYVPTAATSAITGATQANPCVLTLPTTNMQGIATNSNSSLAAASVGMQLSIAGVAGMTQLNGNTYTISAINVGGDATMVAINVDSSAFSAYTSGGTATYVNSPVLLNTLRYAVKFDPILTGWTTANYNAFVSAGGEFPSQYNLSGSSKATDTTGNIGTGEVWGLFDPDLYTPPSTAYAAIVSFNH